MSGIHDTYMDNIKHLSISLTYNKFNIYNDLQFLICASFRTEWKERLHKNNNIRWEACLKNCEMMDKRQNFLTLPPYYQDMDIKLFGHLLKSLTSLLREDLDKKNKQCSC